jgi:hypothetical protein
MACSTLYLRVAPADLFRNTEAVCLERDGCHRWLIVTLGARVSLSGDFTKNRGSSLLSLRLMLALDGRRPFALLSPPGVTSGIRRYDGIFYGYAERDVHVISRAWIESQRLALAGSYELLRMIIRNSQPLTARGVKGT